MKIYIFRHGETDWNIKKKCQGQTDIMLNSRGIEIAKITAEAIEDIPFDYIFSSPLVRALTTAQILRGNRPLEIVTDDRLKEICFGAYEGLEPSERPEKFMYFFTDPEKFEPAAGGETYEELIQRTSEFLMEKILPIKDVNPDANVLISGHGAMNRALITFLLDRPIKDFWAGTFQKNCCMNLFDVTDSGIVLLEEGKIFYDE